jgi:16S rRNA (guanine966-N2)-methyltransferase
MLTITSGKYKNISLYLPPENITRPISQKVRAAIFNSLAQKVVDANVLDLFAGSGAMAIEAMSRGARAATLVDNIFKSLSVIKKNVQKLDTSENFTIINNDVSKFIASSKEKFDIIFIDPPYNQFDINMVKRASNLLQYGGIIVISRTSKIELGNLGKTLQVASSKNYGDTQIEYINKLN